MDGLSMARLAAALIVALRDHQRTPTELRRKVSRRLRRVLVAAYDTVPFYREQMVAVRYNPHTDYRGPEDLTRLPILTKETLKRVGPRSLTRAGASLEREFSDATSGTTGTPIQVWRDPWARALQVARWLRVLIANGYKPWELTLSLTSPGRLGEGASRIQKLGLFRRIAINYLAPPAEVVDALVHYRPQVLYANRSHLELMAAVLAERSLRPPRLRLILTGAETVREKHRQTIRAAFGVEPVESYGSVELGIIAFQRPQSSGMVLCEDLLFCEVVDDHGVPVEPGRAGRMVATDLTNRLMPFIRYDQGDRVVLSHEKGPNGWRCLAGVEGRDDDLAILPGGRRVPFHVFYEAFDRYPEVRQFRVVQKSETRFLVFIAAGEADFARSSEAIRLALEGRLPAGLVFDITRVDSIPPDPGGKLRMLISEVGDRSPAQRGAQ